MRSRFTAISVFAFVLPAIATYYALAEERVRTTTKLVDALASQNEEPVIDRTTSVNIPLFDKSFDWEDQKRVSNAIKDACHNVDTEWPLLVIALNDERYSVTVNHAGRSVSNLSVGDVCELILAESLAVPYRSDVPKRESAQRALAYPDVVRSREFPEWIAKQKRDNKQLYELQIEMCDWAIKEMKTVRNVPNEEREEAIRKMHETIVTLKKTKKPIVAESIFNSESRTIFSKDHAMLLRKKTSKE